MARTLPQSVYAPDVLPRLLLDGVGQRLHVVGAGQRVGCACEATLVSEDLLGAERDASAPLGRERQRLVEGVGVQALGSAHDRRERLHRGADYVVLGLLGGEDEPAVWVWKRAPGSSRRSRRSAPSRW